MTRAAISSAHAASSITPAKSAAGATRLVRALRRLTSALGRAASEPLLHFALLGALVFAGHRLLAPAIEPPTIEVSAAKQRELGKLFEQRQRRPPTDAERQQLIQRHVEDEALFREGLRLSLVQTDPTLRAQLVSRMRSMLQAELDPSPPTEAELTAYYQARRADYTRPEAISYREYLIPTGPDANDASRRLLSLLRGLAGDAVEAVPRPSEYAGYSRAQLSPVYGDELARQLWALPSGGWHELRSSRGVHLVRIDERALASEPPFATLRERVSADYRKDRTARAFQAELSRLTAPWRVLVADPP